MRPLYAITSDLIALDDVLDACEGDLSKAHPEVDAWLEDLAGEQAVKLDSFVNLIRSLEMEAARALAEAEQYVSQSESRTRKAECLKARLADHLRATGQAKARTESGRTVAIVGNGGQKPLVVDVADPLSVDERFRKIETSTTVNKAAIREALEAGESLPFAHFAERGTHLRIT